jgi:hypothetical protein
MKFWILSFLLILTFQLSAQTTVQWASRVINYSTELTGLQYSAGQVLEKPNILPSGGDNANAWTAYKNDTPEYIKVGFDLPMPILNSEVDDMFLHLPLDGFFGYFCREVEGNDLDIHTFTLPLVTLGVDPEILRLD